MKRVVRSFRGIALGAAVAYAAAAGGCGGKVVVDATSLDAGGGSGGGGGGGDCTPGAVKCAGGVPQTCDASGHWQSEGAPTIAAGSGHTCARKADGTLWCWGANTKGQLGDGTTNDSPVPVQVSALGATVVDIAAGYEHTCARRTDGTLWCWGGNGGGELGNGTTNDSLVPVQVGALGATVAGVAAAWAHACARKTDGTLWCWGSGGEGTYSKVPMQVSALGATVAGVAAGRWHTCARKADGTLWCWGANTNGQVGDGTTNWSFVPVQVSALGTAVVGVAAGSDHTCARVADSTLWCWGANDFGELGDGTTNMSLVPVQVSALGAAVVDVVAAVGYSHTCARKTDGTLWCWGGNSGGQLGDGTTNDSPMPVQVPLSLGTACPPTP